jgi:hypothetical protein
VINPKIDTFIDMRGGKRKIHNNPSILIKYFGSLDDEVVGLISKARSSMEHEN